MKGLALRKASERAEASPSWVDAYSCDASPDSGLQSEGRPHGRLPLTLRGVVQQQYGRVAQQGSSHAQATQRGTAAVGDAGVRLDSWEEGEGERGGEGTVGAMEMKGAPGREERTWDSMME